MNGFAIELGGHLGRVGDVSTIHEPKPRGDRRCKGNAVIDEGEGRGTSDVFPLGPSRASCHNRIKPNELHFLTSLLFSKMADSKMPN